MFVPRHPVIENQFCQFTTTSGTSGVGGVLAYAGSVCYLDPDATNQEAVVKIYSGPDPGTTDSVNVPFGFLMQKVKSGYHDVHPAGYYMPGDLGSSDVIAQPSYSSAGKINGTKLAPVGVAHLGIWDTIHYMVKFSGGTPTAGTAEVAAGDRMKPNQLLYVCNNSVGVSGAGTSPVTNQSGANTSYGTFTNVTTAVARVVKGANAAQCQANINNTTLYPIRIKLLI